MGLPLQNSPYAHTAFQRPRHVLPGIQQSNSFILLRMFTSAPQLQVFGMLGQVTVQPTSSAEFTAMFLKL